MRYSIVTTCHIYSPQAPLAQLFKEGNKDLEVEALRIEEGLRSTVWWCRRFDTSLTPKP